MKKAQLQLGETIFAVIIILFLIIFGLVFYNNERTNTTSQQRNEFTDLETVSLTQLATNLVELQCSTQGVREQSCYDISRIESFVHVRESEGDLANELYFSQFGNAEIKIEQIYPQPEEGEGEWDIYYNELEGFTFAPQVIIPISLYDGVLDQYYFGILYVRKFS